MKDCEMDRTMKRVSVLHIHRSSQIGGSELQMVNLVSNLNRERFLPIVACPINGPLTIKMRQAGVQVYDVPVRSVLDLKSLQLLIHIIHHEQVRIVHCHLGPSDILGTLAAMIGRAPVRLYTKHSIRPTYLTYPSNLERLLAYHLGHYLLTKRVSSVIAVSGAVREALIECEGVPSRKVITVFNGIDSSEYCQFIDRMDARRALGLPIEAQILLCVARLSPEKGQCYLLKAIEHVHGNFPDIHLLLAGDGPSQQELIQQSESLGIKDTVHFLGMRNDIPLLLAASDVLVLPSLYEGFGLAIIEAMFAARPVICTDAGGPREIVQHGITGLLVPPANVNALAKAIKQILNDPAQAAIMGCVGRTNAAVKFTIQRMVAETEAIYDQLLS
jgi:glycosyltransferase involved in cell wall biosynthesis